MTTLASDIAQILTARRETVAVAESCTGGFIAHQLTNIPGASAWFERGVVCYSNQSKIDWLGNQPHSGVEGGTLTALPGGGATLAHIIDKNGAVSSECAEAMALGIRKIAATTYGIAVTGIAGPTGGTSEKPVGTVFIGIAIPTRCSVIEHHFPSDRETFKSKVCEAALQLLKKELK